MNIATPTPTPSPIPNSSSSPPTIPIVFAGIFGTILLCAALFTADWYYRRNRIGQSIVNYGFEKGWVRRRSDVRGRGLLSESQAAGDYVKERRRGEHSATEDRGAAHHAEEEHGHRRRDGRGETSETMEGEDSENTYTSTSSSEERQDGLRFPRLPAQTHRRAGRLAIGNESPEGIERFLAPQAKLVPHYVAANMNWAYQKGYGDAARWLDIEKTQRSACGENAARKEAQENGYWPEWNRRYGDDVKGRHSGKTYGATAKGNGRRTEQLGRNERARRTWLGTNEVGRIIGEV